MQQKEIMNESEAIRYIVHSPPSDKPEPRYWKQVAPNQVDKTEIHRQLMIRAIRFALGNNIPVVVEEANGLQKARLDRLLTTHGIDPSEIKRLNLEQVAHPRDMKQNLQKISPNPRRIIVMGYYRELCCVSCLGKLRDAFPDTKITMLKGDYAISHRNHLTCDSQHFEHLRRGFKRAMGENQITRANLSKKLLR